MSRKRFRCLGVGRRPWDHWRRVRKLEKNNNPEAKKKKWTSVYFLGGIGGGSNREGDSVHEVSLKIYRKRGKIPKENENQGGVPQKKAGQIHKNERRGWGRKGKRKRDNLGTGEGNP